MTNIYKNYKKKLIIIHLNKLNKENLRLKLVYFNSALIYSKKPYFHQEQDKI